MFRKLLNREPPDAPVGGIDNPVFVVGSVRSGTTYLNQLLNCHPNLILGNEDRLPRLLLDTLEMINTPPGTVRYRALSTDPEKSRRIGHEGVLGFFEQPDLLAAFRTLYTRKFREAVRDFYAGPRARALQAQLQTDKSCATRWGDKLGTFWPGGFLREHFPGAQFVHVIRDGRDVVVSMRAFAKRRESAPWRKHSFEQLCSSWVETVSRLRRCGHQCGESAYREIRYEGLVTREKKTLFELFNFLGEDIEAPVESSYRRFRRRLNPKLFQEHGTSRDPKHSVGRWKVELSGKEIATAREVMGSLLSELGYLS